jgi:hypothetical protein
MEDYDFEILTCLIDDYPIDVIISSLEKIVATKADQLVDQGLGDKSKDFTRVAWHLHLLTGSPQ